ncbi:hybrid sensor histidine kinase/response regulator transcription factor [uncultured Dysgonomonas sp.]|uniref:histidine kinase n=1 Tax=uncultured Dysgonomonas sp. TaxID=206096 RepID=A0A212K6W9_9BACT|nr:hybrid sensor histidine kinase/response regulator transcription factor [uncultured Dysgonomonas sp.]SBW07451.1 conserved exported hypothetical protein [uncultured Dysgonomonas sp.]
MKHSYRILLLSFFCLFLIVPETLRGRENKKYYFKRIDNSMGLSQNTVTCILQDKLGFMWFGTKDGLNKYDGHSFSIFRQRIGDEDSIKDNFITVLCEARNEYKLWIGTSNGIYIYDMQKETFTHFIVGNSDININCPINDIQYDNNGILWIATQGQGLFSYDEKQNILKRHLLGELNEKSDIRSLELDSRGFLWFSINDAGLFFSKDNLITISRFTHDDIDHLISAGAIYDTMIGTNNHLYIISGRYGLFEINIISQKVKKLLDPNINGNKVFMRKVTQFSENELWIGAESGILIYNTETSKCIHFKHELGDPYSLSDNAIHSLYKDKDGNMWIGTYFGGVNFYSTQSSLFDKYYRIPGKGGLSGERVREFREAPDGNIWIGTEDGGLNLFSPNTTMKFTPFLKDKLHYNIHALYHDRDNYLWVGTFSEGLYEVDLSTNAVTHYKKGRSTHDLKDNTVYELFKDKEGIFWIGTGAGLQIFDEKLKKFTTIEDLGLNLIRDIAEGKNGNLYCATAINGLFCYNRVNQKWTNFSYQIGDTTSLPHNNVLSIFIDSKDQLWVTTQGGGFARFNEKNGTFNRFSTYNKLPNDVAYEILEDDKGLFWISTNEGLIHFNPESGEFFTYSYDDGLLSKQFNYKSALRADNGMFYFGSLNGFISFNPNDTYQDNIKPNVVLTDFLLFNRKVKIEGADSPLKESIMFTDEIRLDYHQNYFTLKFADLNYQRTKHNQYLYKLEGYDEEWLSTNESYTINYPNVRPGKYNFRLKLPEVSDADLIYLPIEILPPWWESNLAYCFYLAFVVLVVYGTYKYLSKQNMLKARQRLRLYEQEKEREVYTAKIDFFTDIAHEIRTPLTLIKSPLENIIKNKDVSDDMRDDLEVIDKNANRLQDLTNQLLDFRKIEKQRFHLTFARYDIIKLINDVLVRFNQVIKLKNILLNIELPSEPFYAYVDKESVTKIISNLLTNAIKNTDTYITVELHRESIKEEGCFDLVVKNDGEIIPANQREEIFKPFVQYKSTASALKAGTGLGLTLSRSLAELHQGFLAMDTVDDANSFRLTIPLLQEWVNKNDGTVRENLSIPNYQYSAEDERKQINILIVEDDLDLLAYISKLLSPYYNILTATDGIKALEVLEKEIVNLIITDIMMPNIDGYELCKDIRMNLFFSHIPIVFLSAKNSLSSKIEGLDSGADAYIEKPFSNEFLMATVSNLLANRNKMIEAFKRSAYTSISETAFSKTDEAFMKTVNKVIEENLGNPEFSQDDFAAALNMSKSSLYRKTKGLFDVSPNDFIRIKRIKKAAQLFDQKEDSVSEVCYTVGFSSPSYFSKCFYRQFNLTPKEYIDAVSSRSKLNSDQE